MLVLEYIYNKEIREVIQLFPNSLFKILLAILFLYIAWPTVSVSLHSFANIFWLCWLCLFFLVVGGNLSTLLKITSPSLLEEEIKRGQKDSL